MEEWWKISLTTDSGSRSRLLRFVGARWVWLSIKFLPPSELFPFAYEDATFLEPTSLPVHYRKLSMELVLALYQMLDRNQIAANKCRRGSIGRQKLPPN